jgi:hypothetical protein
VCVSMEGEQVSVEYTQVVCLIRLSLVTRVDVSPPTTHGGRAGTERRARGQGQRSSLAQSRSRWSGHTLIILEERQTTLNTNKYLDTLSLNDVRDQPRSMHPTTPYHCLQLVNKGQSTHNVKKILLSTPSPRNHQRTQFASSS